MKSRKLSLIFLGVFIALFLLSIAISAKWIKFSPEKASENFENKQLIIKKSTLNIKEGNAIVTNIWLENEEKLDKFAESNIKYLFVDVGEIDSKGKLTTPENEITDFLTEIRSYEQDKRHDFILLPYTEIIIGETYDLSQEFANGLVDEYSYLTKLGFDGVHVDVEAIPFSERQEYLKLLERIRDRIGQGKLITVYSGSYSENPSEWEWNDEFYREVSNRADIIAMPGYDTGLDTDDEYWNYVKNQVEFVEREELSAKFLFSVPTHKQNPETIENSLRFFSESENSQGNSNSGNSQSRFIGIAIFAEWTTDEHEWKVFEDFTKKNT